MAQFGLRGDVNLGAKKTATPSTDPMFLMSLRNLRPIVDRSALWHTFSTGRHVRVQHLHLTQQEPAIIYSVTVTVANSARYALSGTLSCAASGCWSVWSVGCPQSRRCCRLGSPSFHHIIKRKLFLNSSAHFYSKSHFNRTVVSSPTQDYRQQTFMNSSM